MLVKMWMTKKLVVAKMETTISEAEALLRENNIRRLLVVDDDSQLRGVLSREDVRKALPSLIDPDREDAERVLANEAKAASFMTESPITVSPNTPLEKVARLMQKNKVGGVPVVENGKLVGIITESDIFRAFIDIMGGDDEGVRLELFIDNSAQAIYDVMDILSEHEVLLQSISLYKEYSGSQQLLTVKVTGDEMEEVIESLWDGGIKVGSVITPIGE